jgi:hypothetical protein
MVRRGYVYRRGTAACVPRRFSAKKKKKGSQYGFGTGRVGYVRVRYGASQNGAV